MIYLEREFLPIKEYKKLPDRPNDCKALSFDGTVFQLAARKLPTCKTDWGQFSIVVLKQYCADSDIRRIGSQRG